MDYTANPKSNCWIAPNGKITWCDYHNHDDAAVKHYDKTEYELEQSRYMKVSKGVPIMGYHPTRQPIEEFLPTNLQVSALKKYVELSEVGNDVVNEWVMDYTTSNSLKQKQWYP